MINTQSLPLDVIERELHSTMEQAVPVLDALSYSSMAHLAYLRIYDKDIKALGAAAEQLRIDTIFDPDVILREWEGSPTSYRRTLLLHSALGSETLAQTQDKVNEAGKTISDLTQTRKTDGVTESAFSAAKVVVKQVWRFTAPQEEQNAQN